MPRTAAVERERPGERKQLGVILDLATFEEVRQAARSRDLVMSQIGRRAIRAYLDALKDEEPAAA